MKRKEVISALLNPGPMSDAEDTNLPKPARVSAGSVRAIGLELGRLTDEANQAEVLRQQMANGSSVVELDPEGIEPSFIADRLAPTSDAQFRQLIESIRKDGQKIPILVRPHPEAAGMYQIAYGHRRWHAARELGTKIRAIVQTLNDAELVVAQGKENSDRRNLSFIERALFAANLRTRGFDRSTINAALAVQTAETSRLLAVADAIPWTIVSAIGPAPKAGRTRWMELAEYLVADDTARIAEQTLEQATFKRLGSDARFEVLIAALRVAASSAPSEWILNVRGQPVVRAAPVGQGVRLWIDERFAAGFGAYLMRSLPNLVRCFDEGDQSSSDSD
jgi:ParB family transcriptional regulator, chromosome partitioning protein